jgi:hypothetical protein
MEASSSLDSRIPTPITLVERLRAVHLQMVDAVLTGDGLERVAALAAGAVGGPVCIVVPRLGAAVASPGATADLAALRRYVAERIKDRPAPVPAEVAAEVPIASGDERIGGVLLLHGATGEAAVDPSATEFLHLAAFACLTEVAVEEARRRSSRTCAARSSRTCARGPTSIPWRSCGAPRGWGATSRAGPSCCVPS